MAEDKVIKYQFENFKSIEIYKLRKKRKKYPYVS